MEFQLSYFKSWKMMLWKCCTQYASKFGKLSSGHRTGKGQCSFHSQRKAMPKNVQTTTQLHSFDMLKILQASLQQYMNQELPDVQSVQSLSHVQLFATPWTAECQASLSITNSQSPPKLIFIELVMPSSHLILCCPLLLLPSIFPSVRVFSNESALRIRWPKDWSFSFRISPSNEHPGLISFRMNWLDLLAVQGTLKSLLQHHTQFKSINSSALSFLYSPTLTSIHDYWKNHSFD